mgnify:FL=1
MKKLLWTIIPACIVGIVLGVITKIKDNKKTSGR